MNVSTFEEWKTHPVYENLQCSNTGCLRKIKRTPKRIKYIPLDGRISLKGYRSICINSKSIFVHRLIAETFIINEENKPFINHKDGDRLNNNVTNLEWCTSQENSLHSFHINGRDTQYKKRSVDILKDGNLLHTAPSVRIAATYIKGDSSNISRCCKGTRKQHMGYTFRYSTQPKTQPKGNSYAEVLKMLHS